MKKALLGIALVILTPSIWGQITLDINQPYKVEYLHEFVLPVNIYLNGVKTKNFQLSSIGVISTNTTNLTLQVQMPGLQKGQHIVTATVEDGGIESDQSNQYTIRVKPNKPFINRVFGL